MAFLPWSRVSINEIYNGFKQPFLILVGLFLCWGLDKSCFCCCRKGAGWRLYKWKLSALWHKVCESSKFSQVWDNPRGNLHSAWCNCKWILLLRGSAFKIFCCFPDNNEGAQLVSDQASWHACWFLLSSGIWCLERTEMDILTFVCCKV